MSERTRRVEGFGERTDCLDLSFRGQVVRGRVTSLAGECEGGCSAGQVKRMEL